MFGSSNPFRQSSSSSPFGSQTQSAFGQTNNVSSNPFGASSPFGAQTGNSMFGGTSTGIFGAPQASSPLGASSQAFGSSTPAFGHKSFIFTVPQSSSFGSTTQQSQPEFGNNTFGSSRPFGALNTTAFGSTNTPAFGATSTPAFGASSTLGFGSPKTPAFGASNTPSYVATISPTLGASPTPAFGSSGTTFGNNVFGSGGGFGTSSSPFGAPNTPAFGASSTPAFGQSTSGFGSNAFGSTQSPFGAQGAQASNPTFGGQQVGSRVTAYAHTTEADSDTGTQTVGKLISISAMHVYKYKNHEELRYEDYQRGDKGGQPPAGPSLGGTNSQPSLFAASPAFSQTSAYPANIFSSTTATNPFGQNASTTTSNFSSPFGQTTTPSMFGPTSSTTTSVFGPSPTFAATPSQSLFASSSTPLFSSNFASPPAYGSTPGFNNSQSSALFSSNPSFSSEFSLNSQSSVLFSSNPSFAQTGSAFAQLGQNTNPSSGQTNNFSTPSTGFSNMFSSSSSFTTSSSPFNMTTPVACLTPNQPAQPSGSFSFNGSGQNQIANTPGFTNGMGSFNQSNFEQVPVPANPVVIQPIPVTNPFGTLPALPQISIAQGGSSPSIQYGISSMPVVDTPAPARISPLLTSRHILQRWVRPPVRKYRPGDDGPKVPFFSDEENSNTLKADALFIPRETPRALFIRPVERVKSALPKEGPTPLQENGVTNGANHEDKDNDEVHDAPPVKENQKPNMTHGGEKNGLPSGADIESLMPKLHHSEYFTEPRILELAAKERVNPGHCSRVRDFVVGRHGYGSIKFLGETDVRKLDLETLVQFNNREVIVYMDESKKPPVGQGLNKPAEVTLLNIKCIDKKSGKQVKEGTRVAKYVEMLKRKTEEQGAQFVSYDVVIGEWMFKVEHFSSYNLGDEDDE